jgi:N-acetylmuramoyl-L-alanine amidase
LSDKTGKSYQVIRSFLKTIDTTITSATQPVPSDFVFEEPYVIGSFEKQWQNGQSAPKFPYISSVEELEAELKNVTREVTEVVVHWTETPTNKNIGSEELNAIHLESGLKGIGYHYVIRRDGSIQRGRPVNIQGNHAPVNDHDKLSIGIVFVGGINVSSGTPNLENFVSVQSLTRSQFNSFDHFCRAFYNRFSGGQIIGHNDIDTNEEDPGFNVREYVFANFGKESKFTNPLKQSPFTIDEINNDE